MPDLVRFERLGGKIGKGRIITNLEKSQMMIQKWIAALEVEGAKL